APDAAKLARGGPVDAPRRVSRPQLLDLLHKYVGQVNRMRRNFGSESQLVTAEVGKVAEHRFAASAAEHQSLCGGGNLFAGVQLLKVARRHADRLQRVAHVVADHAEK